jgi:hypothetical protein
LSDLFAVHKSDGRSPAGVVKARRRENFIRGVFSAHVASTEGTPRTGAKRAA